MTYQEIPFVVWTPESVEPWLFDTNKKPKCPTLKLFYEMIVTDDALELCNRHKINLEELCVALTFETVIRTKQAQKELSEYIKTLSHWCVKNLKHIKKHGYVLEQPPLFRAVL